ncbi:MAG: DUF4249 family protein [Cytophagales bacterium]|nr:DUF4249 family protein [Cytophagales bacterium]
MKTLDSVRLFLVASLLLYGCSLQEDFEYASQRDLIAANGFLHPDSTVSVSLARTAPYPKGDSVIPLEGALVKLYENDVLLGDVPYDAEKRAYTLNYYPKETYAYRLVVRVNGKDSLTATTRIPANSIVQACANEYSPEGTGWLSGRVRTNMHIERTDPVATVWIAMTSRNFKRYRVEGPPYSRVDSSVIETRPFWSLYTNSAYADPFNGYKDEGLNGYMPYLRLNPASRLPTYDLDVGSMEGGYYDAHQRLPDGLGQYVHVYTASEEYDRFLKNAVINYLNSNEEADIPNPFAEQVVTYSNVKGGTGVFAGYHAATFYVRNLNKCQ